MKKTALLCSSILLEYRHVMNKITIVVVLCYIMTGCAHNPMRFNLAPGSTQDDYNKARVECGDSESGGYFLFGPLIILAPVIAAVESVKYSKRHGLQDCLEAKGFKCIENCAHVSQYVAQDQPKQSYPAVHPTVIETKEVAIEPAEPSTSSANEIKRDGRFIAYDNGTVLDTKTNLMWAAKDNGADINWGNAKIYCENYCGGGYMDWRLPTQNELAQLYNNNKPRPMSCEPSYNARTETGLIDISCFYLWASENNNSFFSSKASLVGFFDGERTFYRQSYSSNMRVLPVRLTK